MFPFIELMVRAITVLSIAPLADSPLLQSKLPETIVPEAIKNLPQVAKGSFFEYFSKPQVIVPIPTRTVLLATNTIPTPTAPYLDPYTGWPVRLVFTLTLSWFLFGIAVCFGLCMAGQFYYWNQVEQMRLEDEEDKRLGDVDPDEEEEDWAAMSADVGKAWSTIFIKAIGCCALFYFGGFYLCLLALRLGSPSLTLDEYYMMMNYTSITPHDPIYAWASYAVANLSGSILTAAPTPFLSNELFVELFERAQDSIALMAGGEPATQAESDALEAEAHFNILRFLQATRSEDAEITVSELLESAQSFKKNLGDGNIFRIDESSTPTNNICYVADGLQPHNICGLKDSDYQYLVQPSMFRRLPIDVEDASNSCSSATSLELGLTCPAS